MEKQLYDCYAHRCIHCIIREWASTLFRVDHPFSIALIQNQNSKALYTITKPERKQFKSTTNLKNQHFSYLLLLLPKSNSVGGISSKFLNSLYRFTTELPLLPVRNCRLFGVTEFLSYSMCLSTNTSGVVIQAQAEASGTPALVFSSVPLNDRNRKGLLELALWGIL